MTKPAPRSRTRGLLGLALGDVGGLQAPLGIGLAPPGARARARARRRGRGRSGAPAPPAPPRRPPPAPARCARRPASGARRWASAAACRRRRHRSARCSAWRPPAPASCRRRPRTDRAPAGAGRRPRAAAATCEPSSCTSNQPLPCAASASIGGLRPAPSGAGMRTPTGDKRRRLGAEARQRLHHLLARGFERVDAQIDRRALAQGRRPPRAARAPKARSNDGSSQSGMSPLTCAGASSGSAAASLAVSSCRQRRDRVLGAVGQPPPPRRPSWRRRAGRHPAPARAACRRPSAPRSSSCAAARRRRACRSPPGRRSRRSGAPCPSRRAPSPPAGGGRGCRRGCRPRLAAWHLAASGLKALGHQDAGGEDHPHDDEDRHAGRHGIEAPVDPVGAGMDIGVHQPRDDERARPAARRWCCWCW